MGLQLPLETSCMRGLLFVLAEPGKSVSLDEFHDWYNNEHIPLRLNHLPSFLTGARFSTTDSSTPSWLALYDIESASVFTHPSYTALRANRSPREADIVRRLELLDRRCYELVSDSGVSGSTTSFAVGNPSVLVVSQAIDVVSGDEAFEKWAKGLFDDLKGVDECLRTRTYKCIDSVRSGTGVGEGPEEQRVPRYLVVHEVTSVSILDSPSFQTIYAKSEPWLRVVEERRWQLYRAYPCIAQGNVFPPS